MPSDTQGRLIEAPETFRGWLVRIYAEALLADPPVAGLQPEVPDREKLAVRLAGKDVRRLLNAVEREGCYLLRHHGREPLKEPPAAPPPDLGQRIWHVEQRQETLSVGLTLLSQRVLRLEAVVDPDSCRPHQPTFGEQLRQLAERIDALEPGPFDG